MELQNNIENLLENTSILLDKYNQISINQGEYFNIFSIAELQYDELFHSKFIAEFLNPNGSHNLKSTFLNLFIEYISKNVTNKPILFDIFSAQITIEKNIGEKTETDGGRIDILLIDKNNNKIIIENKIFARDQENQLLRYSNYAEKKNTILYLTPYGKPPKLKNNDETKNFIFYLISYKEHIINWLNICLEKVDKIPIIKETINQYQNLLKVITNQTVNHDLKMEISSLIRNNLLAANEINRNFEDTKLLILEDFWQKAINLLQANLKEEWNVTKKILENRYKEPYLLFSKKHWKNTYIYCHNLHSKLFYGITAIEKNGLNCKELHSNLKLKDEFSSLKAYKPTQWSIFWEYRPEFNFKDIKIINEFIENETSMLNSFSYFMTKFVHDNTNLCEEINILVNK